MTRVNLTLALLVILLALAALFGPNPVQEDAAPAALTTLDPQALQQIRIDRGPHDTMAFQHSAQGWRMTAPFDVAAHPDRLQALARIAATPSYRSFPASQANLEELGLAPPVLTFTLDGQTLKIGGIEPLRHRRYVLLGERVHLIDDLFQHHLLAQPTALVDPHPFPGTLHQATLADQPVSREALRRLQQSQAVAVEQTAAAPKTAVVPLQVWMEDEADPLHFMLDSAGKRLWRKQPPLLYHLSTPLMLDPVQQTSKAGSPP